MSEGLLVVFLALGGLWLLIGYGLACSLLLIFSLALLSVVLRKVQTTCHCFGESQQPVSVIDLWRNAGLLLCARVGATTIWLERSEGITASNLWLMLLVGLIAIVFALVWTQLSEIVRIFREI